MDVRLPNGTILRNVPEGTPKEAVMQKAVAAGLASQDDFQMPESAVQSPDDAGQAQQAPNGGGNGKGDFYRNLQRRLVGGLQVGGSIASSALAEPLAGISGIVNAAIPGGPTGPEAIESVREGFTYKPTSETGQQYMQNTAEFVAPLSEAISGGGDYLGDAVFEKTKSPTLAAAAKSFPTLVAELVGVGATKGAFAASRARNASKVTDMMESAAPTTDQLREVASGLYREIDDMGAMVDPGKLNNLAEDIVRETRKRGVDPDVTPAANKAVQRIVDAAKAGDPITFTELDTLRAVAKGAAGKVTDKQEAMLGSLITEKIDDFMGSSGIIDSSLSKSIGSEVGARLKTARELWGRMRKSELIEEATSKAELQASGYENGLRTQFRAILNNKKKRSAFTPEERKAMSDVVTGTNTTNALKKLGKLGFGEGGASNMLGGSLASAAAYSVGGVPAALGVAGVGTAARRGAQSMTNNMARSTDAMIRAGRDAKDITAQYLRSTKNPRPEELADLFLRRDVEIPQGVELDEFTRKAMEIARQRRAELGSAAAVGAGERGTSENVVPFAIGR